MCIRDRFLSGSWISIGSEAIGLSRVKWFCLLSVAFLGHVRATEQVEPARFVVSSTVSVQIFELFHISVLKA